MPSWDPNQYLKFADDRLRPALDLMARVDLARPRVVYDLGCGPGNITKLLVKRWPETKIIGVDSSAAMLAKALAEAPGVTYVEADINQWRPAHSPEMIFSNAALHWLPDHEILLPRLTGFLTPGGILAVQMPYNHRSPSQLAIQATVVAGPWRRKLRDARGILPVATPAAYYRVLSPAAAHIDIWETEYQHVLEGDDPVVEWMKGTAMRPFLDALAEPERTQFLAAYSARIAADYPREPDGRTLFPFRRIFIVARV
jgi:trans-aconitate 2-methyltransferase